MLTIRQVRPSDLDQLILLIEDHAAYEGAEWRSTNRLKADLASLMFSQDKLWCYVVEDDGALIGYATSIIQYATWTAQPYLYMDCLYLKEEARGQGLGTQLMQQLVELAKQNGLTEIQWQTPINNQSAIAFYKRIGANILEKARCFLAAH